MSRKTHTAKAFDKSISVHDNPHAKGEKNINIDVPLTGTIINVNVETFDSIRTQLQLSEIIIRVEFMNIQVAESDKILCNEEGHTDINFEFSFPSNYNKIEALDELTANPLVFTLCDISSVGPNKPSKDAKKKEEKTVVLGRCNLDLLPLLLGEIKMKENLLVELDSRVTGHEVITWPNLPSLSVSVWPAEPLTTPDSVSDGNLLFFTVQSMYNLPSKMTDLYSYTAATRLPITSSQFQEIFFKGGFRTERCDPDKTKRWCNLMDTQGRGIYSKYKLINDINTIKTELSDEQLKELNKDGPRVEWNSMRRCWLTKPSCDVIYENLAKYRNWPLELMCAPKLPDNVKHKTKDPTVQAIHLTAYLDLTALLYPGVVMAQAATQLHTFSQEDMILKCGKIKSMFEGVQVGSFRDVASGRKKTADQKSSNKVAINVESEESNVPLVNDLEEPVFIVVEMELMKPFIRKRSEEELAKKVEDIIPPHPTIPKRVMAAGLAEEHYQRCIHSLTELITTEYQAYVEKSDQNSSTGAPLDMTDDFSLYLQSTGSYHKMKETLRNKITTLVREKFCDNLPPKPSRTEMQNFVSDVYIYLVEEMHIIINSLVEDGERIADPIFTLSYSQANYFALEALEEGNVNRAQQLYLELIAKEKKNPDVWLAYAVFCLSQNNIGKALECIKESLTLNNRHKLSMLMYGILLYQYNDYDNAKLFLEALTCFYPRFVEAWLVFHLLYIQMQVTEGADITLQMSKKCFNRFPEELNNLYIIDTPSWSSISEKQESIYLSTANLLMKLRMHEFAEQALALELGCHGSSVPYLYYLAVNHFLTCRYQEALVHLQNAIKQSAQEVCLWSVMGHCYFKLNNIEKAKECYKFIAECENKPSDIHLVNLRLGSYYLQDEDYNLAKRTFLDACTSSPSPLSWLGVGKACYMLHNFLSAEQALTEANILDNTCPITWAYLTLINLQYEKQAEFEQCYRQTLKHNLRDEMLLKQIKTLQNALEYPDPVSFGTGIEYKRGFIFS